MSIRDRFGALRPHGVSALSYGPICPPIEMTHSPYPQRHGQPHGSSPRMGAGRSARALLTDLRRAVDLHLAGNYVAAEERLRAVLRVEPLLPQAHHHLAVVLHAQRQYSDAVRHLTIAADLDPHLPGIQERLDNYVHDALGRRSA